MTNSFSTARLPLDNLLSGALIGAMGGVALNYSDFKDKKISTCEFSKKVGKFALETGVAAGVAIYASNSIVSKNYTNAILAVGAGIGALILSQKFLTRSENE